MPLPWVTIVRWVLPELISTVRNFKKQQAAPTPHEDDLTGRIEKLEKALELQSQINEDLTLQLQHVQKRLQILTFVAVCGLILAAVALAVLTFK
ncbi:MAG TPA: hypothetical protein VGJ57_06470 [Nitrospirales bacterium]|jgi:hypothetical protein